MAISMTRVNQMAFSNITIRNLSIADFKAVAKIDEKNNGDYKPEYWHKKLNIYTADPEVCFGAEAEGRLVGFVLGHVKGGEFGTLDETGWLEIMGVDPQWQRNKIAERLVAALFAAFERRGVDKVYTLTAWDKTDMIGFLSSLGFRKSELQSLEKRI